MIRPEQPKCEPHDRLHLSVTLQNNLKPLGQNNLGRYLETASSIRFFRLERVLLRTLHMEDKMRICRCEISAQEIRLAVVELNEEGNVNLLQLKLQK